MEQSHANSGAIDYKGHWIHFAEFNGKEQVRASNYSDCTLKMPCKTIIGDKRYITKEWI